MFIIEKQSNSLKNLISDKAEVLAKFIDFSSAEDEFDPICLRNKDWQLIKEDVILFSSDSND